MEQLSGEYLTFGLIWYVVFLFSTTCHEAAHAFAAKIGGDTTASQGGQVTLNPSPHIKREPFGMVIVPILSYLLGGWMVGWASAPFDPYWQQRYPHRAAWMSLAGPGANFALAIVAALAIHIGMLAGVFQAPDTVSYQHITEVAASGPASGLLGAAATFLSVLFFENILLGTFNLLPLPPLDGSTGIAIFMKESTAERFLEFMGNPMFRMTGMLAAWFLFDRIFDPVFTIALKVLYPGSDYQ